MDQHVSGKGTAGTRRALIAAAAIVAFFQIVAEFCSIPHGLTVGMYQAQDRLVALGFIVLFALLLLLKPRFRLRPQHLGNRTVILLACALALLLWIATSTIFAGYAFTRDEQLAVFDAAVFRSWHLAVPLSPEWRAFAPAMEPLYMLPAHDHVAWVSAYLPVNAMLRGAFSLVADPLLLNPLLAAVGGLLILHIAGRLFPQQRSAQLVTLLIYFTSAQMLATAMTPFAMTAHMTFNLLWLALFLRGTRAGHAGAAVTGFLASGLHQIIFHPLFALPFMEMLRRQRRWKALAFYGLVYAAAGIFWMTYQSLALRSAGAAPAGVGGGGVANFIQDRVVPLLVTREPWTLPLMDYNLLRFLVWQNPALLPLCLCALPALRRAEGVALPLAGGIVLTLVAIGLLLPFQSIGWGYRYLHGLLGSFALLAGYGWQWVRKDEQAQVLVATATGFCLCFSIPYLLWQTHSLVRPAIEADRLIASVPADFVVIDAPGLTEAQVRNDPLLRNRPIRFLASALLPRDIDAMCSRGRVAFVDRGSLLQIGLPAVGDPPSSQYSALRTRAIARNCTVNFSSWPRQASASADP